MRLVKAGFEVYAIDNQGHGKSDGIQGFISCFDDLVEDSSQFFTSICGKFYLFLFIVIYRVQEKKSRVLILTNSIQTSKNGD